MKPTQKNLSPIKPAIIVATLMLATALFVPAMWKLTHFMAIAFSLTQDTSETIVLVIVLFVTVILPFIFLALKNEDVNVVARHRAKKAKRLKHKRYTKVRVSSNGRREVYNSDSCSWVPYAAIAYLLGTSDRSVAESCDTNSFSGGGGESGGGGASDSLDDSSSSSNDSESCDSYSNDDDSDNSDNDSSGDLTD